jgi:hypothetical protein
MVTDSRSIHKKGLPADGYAGMHGNNRTTTF